MLKKIVSFFLIIFFSVLALAQEEDTIVDNKTVADYITVPGPIKFNGEEFFLSWSKKNSPTWYQQQYIQRDDDIDNYRERINISFFDKDIDLFEAAKKKMESIEDRKEKLKDPYSFVAVTENPDGTEVMVDFMVTIAIQDKEPYAEYNIDRFKTVKVGDKTGLLIYSYSKRYDGGDLKYLSKVVNKARPKLLEAIIASKMPAIILSTSTK